MPTLLRCFVAFILAWRLCSANEGKTCGNFTVVGGQIYTPGLAILDAPQPCTPEGGDFLQVPLDISGDGKLAFPSKDCTNCSSAIHNISIFLFSYNTNKNFTITNGTGSTPPLMNIMEQEPSSTVKHVNWEWPDCLVGNGQPNGTDSARGEYNISIHQSFRMNGTDYYTIFDLPINVTNEIPQNASSSQNSNDPSPGPTANGTRLACSLLENPLLDQKTLANSTKTPATQPYLGGAVSVSGCGNDCFSNSSSGGGQIGNMGEHIEPASFVALTVIALGVSGLSFL